MSVAEIDLTGLEPGPDLPPAEEASTPPAAARRSLTGLAPRRVPAVSRLRREARASEPGDPDEQERAPAPEQARDASPVVDRAGEGGRRPDAPRARPDVVLPPGRPAQPGARPDQQGARPAVDPRTGAPLQARTAVPGRGYPPAAPGARGPVVRRPPPGYRPGQVPARQRPGGAAAVGSPSRERPAGPSGSPMAPAAQAALAQAAAARAAMAAVQPPEPSAPLDDSLPRYLQLVRKEARVRSDQAEWMAMEVRRINSSRRRRDGVVGERITDNTLIRVALDLLRAQGAALEGTTEDELIRSVLGQDPA